MIYFTWRNTQKKGLNVDNFLSGHRDYALVFPFPLLRSNDLIRPRFPHKERNPIQLTKMGNSIQVANDSNYGLEGQVFK